MLFLAEQTGNLFLKDHDFKVFENEAIRHMLRVANGLDNAGLK